MNVTTAGKIDHKARAKQRRERKAHKRRAYFQDRVMRGKLTSKMKRKVERAPLADLHKLRMAEAKALQEAAEGAELDRIAAIRAVCRTRPPTVEKGGDDIVA